MRYRLALDVGTASLGLIALSLNDANEPVDIVHSDLRIFSEPLLPAKSGGVGEPKKAARRAARVARRLIERRARRYRRIAHLAGLLGLKREEVLPDSGQAIHGIRASAVSERIELDDLLLVLLKLAKRRGYAGGFKTRKEGDAGEVEPGINELHTRMAADGCKTLGQYLANRFERGETLKLKENPGIKLYADRDLIEAEFNAIWDEQAKHHSILSETKADPVQGGVRSIRDQFFDAIFYQRPLKSVAVMVGNCALEPSLPRAPMAQPGMQAFRIEKQLADLRWGFGRSAKHLNDAQRAAIRTMLNDPEQITKEGKLIFEKIYKTLDKQGLMPAERRQFAMDRVGREELLGNRTLRVMKSLEVLDEWNALDEPTQIRVINFLADLGSPEQVDQPNWQLKFTKTERFKNPKTGRWDERQIKRSLDPKMVEFIDHLVSSRKFDRITKMGLDGGRASYSLKALNRLGDHMREHGCDEHAAREALYPQEAATGENKMALPAHKETGNVVVDVALRVMRRAVNDALTALGKPPSQVVVEMSRDMAVGLKTRGEIEKKIAKNKKARDNAKKELETHNHIATERNILRYLLWSDLDQRSCPYCDRNINLADAMNGNATNLEHILPRTLTRVGKQRNHLLLAHRSCNDEKRDRTPFEAFGHVAERWKIIEHQASVLLSNKRFAKAKLLTLKDYEHETLDEETLGEFTERQFHETSWIAKLAALWLREVCSDVAVSRGELTAHLRRTWKLETVIPQIRFDANLPVFDEDKQPVTLNDFKRFKPHWEGHHGSGIEHTDRRIDKRIDHRHHLIDALVIAQTSRSLYNKMATHYKELAAKRMAGEPVKMRLSVAPPLEGLRDKALQLAMSANIRHKPDRNPAGKFFQDTAYRKEWTDDGKIRLTVRVKLVELTDQAGSLEKARKGISDIVSADTRRIVSEEFEKRVASGIGVKEALSLPIADPRFSTSKRKAAITKVAIYQRVGRGFVNGEDALAIALKSNSYKHYLSDGYAYALLMIENGRILSASSVSLFAASRRNVEPRDNERRFYRDDMVRDPENGKCYLIHQVLAGGTVRIAPVSEARVWIDIGKEGDARSVAASTLMRFERVVV